MTPEHVNEIFSSRGYAAARQVASACRDASLMALVERRRRDGKNFNCSAFLAEWDRRAAALAAARKAEAAQAAAAADAFDASVRALQARFAD